MATPIVSSRTAQIQGGELARPIHPAYEDRYQPTPEDSAELARFSQLESSGYKMGVSGQRANVPAGLNDEERKAFLYGHRVGFREYEAEEFERSAEEQERLNHAFASELDKINQDELIEFLGAEMARRMIGGVL